MAFSHDGVGDKKSGYTTTVDVQTSLKAFLYSPQHLPVSLMRNFLVKSKISGFGTILKCWIIRISVLSATGLKKFCYT
jgi:hypothetical protein